MARIRSCWRCLWWSSITSSSVLARPAVCWPSRLTESRDTSVLLLEAGPEDTHPWIRFPISYGKLISDRAVNWCFQSEPRARHRDATDPGAERSGARRLQLDQRPRVRARATPRLRHLVAARQPRLEASTTCCPCFAGSRTSSIRATTGGGRGGPIHVSEAVDRSPLYEALFAAGEAVGIPRNPDYNGASQEGICRTQTNIRRGRRMSAAYGYLAPARAAPQPRGHHRGQDPARAARGQARGRRRVRAPWRAASGAGAQGGDPVGGLDRLAADPRAIRNRSPRGARCAGHRGAARPARSG